jgi:hypothetical protein
MTMPARFIPSSSLNANNEWDLPSDGLVRQLFLQLARSLGTWLRSAKRPLWEVTVRSDDSIPLFLLTRLTPDRPDC